MPNLFSPYTFKDVTLRNRIVDKLPTSESK